ncbi:MAG: VWA domain-containing protein [Clostridia bacterium]|nr:VWA domain-containing protein [Clostridia bacterium]
MTEFNFEIARPWLLLIVVPALILGIIPFFKLHKKRRKATKHIIPFIIHMILIVLLTSLVSGIRITETTTAPTDTNIVFVVDVSKSNEIMKDDMNELMHDIVKASRNEDGNVKFGFVPFANEVMEDDVKNFGELDIDAADYIKYSSAAEISESNIYAALKYAQGMFTDERQNKRIVLLSDGRETEGEARTAVRGILDAGIKLDCAHFDLTNSGEAEIQLVSITTNGKVEMDGEVLISVQIKSTDNVKGTLTIHDGDFEKEEKITLVKGDNKFQFSYITKNAGIHTVYAEIEVNSDTIEQNNQLSSWYKVDGINKILVVDGDGEQTRQLGEVLADIGQEHEYSITRPQDFPATMVDLLEYDEVVLMNVDFTKMPVGADALLKRYVQENGRGLVVTCGNNAYDYSNDAYRESPIEDILPVDLKIEDEKETVALVIIVDLSSSMNKGMGNEGQTRYEVALESAKKALDGLDAEKDYVGVIVFDESATVAVPMSPLKDNVDAIKDKIDYEFEHFYYHHWLLDGEETDIRVNMNDDVDKMVKEGYTRPHIPREGTRNSQGDYIKSYGTNYRWPINEASNMISSAMQDIKLDIKQVVFMSDGEPNDAGSGYDGIVSLMTKAGIVTSTVGIGSDLNTNAINQLELIATKGRGELVIVKDAQALPEKLYEIANAIKGDYYNVRDVKPIMYETNDILRGVTDFDTLGGYYGTTIKDGANLVLYVDNLKPIIAEWEAGLGKVTVFMSNLGNIWTTAMFDDEDGYANKRLVKNILLASLNEQVDSTGIKVNSAKRDGEKTTIRVELPTNVRKTEVLKAIVKDVNGNVVSDDDIFIKSANKKYRATISTPDPTGTYIIELVLVNVEGVEDVLYDTTNLAVVGYYEDEYDIFKVDGKSVLNDLVKVESLSNKLLTNSDTFFDIEKEDMVQYFHDAETPFAIAALILFMLAIFFRNFTFQKTKEKKVMSDEEQYASMRSSGR